MRWQRRQRRRRRRQAAEFYKLLLLLLDTLKAKTFCLQRMTERERGRQTARYRCSNWTESSTAAQATISMGAAAEQSRAAAERMLSAYRVCVRVSVCCVHACIGVSRCTAAHKHTCALFDSLSLSQTLCGLPELTIVGATQETHSLTHSFTHSKK